VAGIILMGPASDANRQAIEHFSGLANITGIPYTAPLDDRSLPRLEDGFVAGISRTIAENTS
ncbi:MAG: hypothetical protein QGF09_17440, partial [Rhodospirillales bacterium]|nr:hypothetical protein [Rhodospirillales bacterium]